MTAMSTLAIPSTETPRVTMSWSDSVPRLPCAFRITGSVSASELGFLFSALSPC